MMVQAYGNFRPARSSRPAGVDYQDIGEGAVVEIGNAYFVDENTGHHTPVSKELVEEMNDSPESIMQELFLI
jgi:hypothetical protein